MTCPIDARRAARRQSGKARASVAHGPSRVGGGGECGWRGGQRPLPGDADAAGRAADAGVRVQMFDPFVANVK
jgi:hypothetical protein